MSWSHVEAGRLAHFALALVRTLSTPRTDQWLVIRIIRSVYESKQ